MRPVDKGKGEDSLCLPISLSPGLRFFVAPWLCGKFIRVHGAWFDLECYCKSGFTGGKFCAENEKGRVVGLEPTQSFLSPLLSIHFKSSANTFDIQCGI